MIPIWCFTAHLAEQTIMVCTLSEVMQVHYLISMLGGPTCTCGMAHMCCCNEE